LGIYPKESQSAYYRDTVHPRITYFLSYVETRGEKKKSIKVKGGLLGRKKGRGNGGRGREDKKEYWGWVPVAHDCELSYSGGRDQEDRGSKPAQANSSRNPLSNHHKKGFVGWLKV
jgi:hypothetical protein